MRFCCCDVGVCGFVVGFVYLCGRCLRPCLFWVGLWVVVLFENSIVCHLMKRILLFEHEHERGHQNGCWCLLFVVVLLVSLFFACYCFLFVFLESLILAQDERWRRA